MNSYFKLYLCWLQDRCTAWCHWKATNNGIRVCVWPFYFPKKQCHINSLAKQHYTVI